MIGLLNDKTLCEPSAFFPWQRRLDVPGMRDGKGMAGGIGRHASAMSHPSLTYGTNATESARPLPSSIAERDKVVTRAAGVAQTFPTAYLDEGWPGLPRRPKIPPMAALRSLDSTGTDATRFGVPRRGKARAYVLLFLLSVNRPRKAATS